MTLEELYRTFLTEPSSKELLKQSHWFASFADFDPKTGDALPMSLTRVLANISNRTPEPFVRDRLWLLMEHSKDSAIRLMNSLSEEPRRESAYLPIRDVRELDTASFIALSRRPGRNIREKLADKPYMQAVRHFQSIDVPENRLLKAYLMHLAEALELRQKYLHDQTDDVEELLQRIYRWMIQDEIKEISRWENLVPNNTLLSHRDYRRVWNSWRLLQSIDDDIEKDMQQLLRRRKTKDKWEKLATSYSEGNTIFADMPVFVDYNEFDIIPWDPDLPVMNAKRETRPSEKFETSEPACIDLTQLRPVYATPSESGTLDDTYFWQRWKIGEDSTDIELFESDGIYLHPDATTVTSSDMFFFKGDIPDVLNRASRSFALRLREHFRNARILWITPDSLNDFELELVRRNLNAVFSKADPLPCSVAAVFKHIDYSAITGEGYKVAVVENINGKSYITELVSRFDEELLDSLPETRGYIWEKGASDIFKADIEADDVMGPMPMLSKDGEWSFRYNPYGASHKANEDSVLDFEGYDKVIWLNTRPVEGGIKLYQLQNQVQNIPLWRNRIPELMTKVKINGIYQPFFLVGRGVTVKPIRGRAVSIDVAEEFTLPAGRREYRLPLLQGANEDALEYEAKLISKDFPYPEDVPCRLEMTYTYGADDPYKLVFRPLNPSYKPINVLWIKKEDVEITDAPGPAYPTPTSWPELQHHYNPKKREYSDLVDWALDSSKTLVNKFKELDEKPQCGKVVSDWRIDKNGKRFSFIEMSNGDDLFMHENALMSGVDPERIAEGDYVYFYKETFKGKTRAKAVAPTKEWLESSSRSLISKRISKYIHQAMYVPFIQVWADGKSTSDPDCPQSFKVGIGIQMNILAKYLEAEDIEQYVRNDLIFLMCCMGKDMPEAANPYIISLIEENSLSENSLGFSLGDASEQWQKNSVQKLLDQNNGFTLRVFARAIWRHERFVEVFTNDDVKLILESLRAKIKKNLKKLKSSNDPSKRKWDIVHMTRYLELLLGLLRLRESSDLERSMMLQPSKDIAKEFAQIVEALIQEGSEHNDKYFSRIQLDLSDKPDDDQTPDLLYALRVYLTGDDAANAIKITGIVEDDD